MNFPNLLLLKVLQLCLLPCKIIYRFFILHSYFQDYHLYLLRKESQIQFSFYQMLLVLSHSTLSC